MDEVTDVYHPFQVPEPGKRRMLHQKGPDPYTSEAAINSPPVMAEKTIDSLVQRYAVHTKVTMISASMVAVLLSVILALLSWHIIKTNDDISLLQRSLDQNEYLMAKMVQVLPSLEAGRERVKASPGEAINKTTPTTPVVNTLTVPVPIEAENVTDSCNQAQDCKECRSRGVNMSGIYHIFPSYGRGAGYEVYCDMHTDGGGWIVFQRRENGSENFYRDWDTYRIGFGNLRHEFWLGNDFIYDLTSFVDVTLRVDLWNWENEHRYAEYDTFTVMNNTSLYEMRLGRFLGGPAGNSLSDHDKYPFATYDNDHEGDRCPQNFQGAWWFRNCFFSHLNGLYNENSSVPSPSMGVIWYSWTRDHYSLKKTEMKIRRNL